MLGAGGPEVRFHMALLQRWISIELLNLITAVQAHYFWVIGTDIARGVLPAPQGDDQWWNNIAIPCADLTIDRGRELNGKIAALKVGALTHADLFGEAGKDWEDQLEIQAEIIAHAATLAAEKASPEVSPISCPTGIRACPRSLLLLHNPQISQMGAGF